jgi:hypothetical protein
MRPSRRGRRYKNSRDGVSVYDGPFVETKELTGFVSPMKNVVGWPSTGESAQRRLPSIVC